MKEVGAVLGIGESRVSQIHTTALLRLRARLHELLQRVPRPPPAAERAMETHRVQPPSLPEVQTWKKF
jgi:hypothetical protein